MTGVIPDGLGQAAGATGDGNGAVAQRDQRSKAARLEGGRGQEEVRPGVHLPRQRFLAGGVVGDGAGVTGRRFLQRPLVMLISPAHDHDLSVQGGHLVHAPTQKVHAFLIHEAGHHAEQGSVRVRLQTAQLLENGLVPPLAFDERPVVTRGDVGVCLGGELLVVHAVEDAVDVARPGAQQAVHAHPVLDGEDLL